MIRYTSNRDHACLVLEQDCRESEVDDPCDPFVCVLRVSPDQEVVKLDISMHDTSRMNVAESTCDVSEDVLDFFLSVL